VVLTAPPCSGRILDTMKSKHLQIEAYDPVCAEVGTLRRYARDWTIRKDVRACFERHRVPGIFHCGGSYGIETSTKSLSTALTIGVSPGSRLPGIPSFQTSDGGVAQYPHTVRQKPGRIRTVLSRTLSVPGNDSVGTKSYGLSFSHRGDPTSSQYAIQLSGFS